MEKAQRLKKRFALIAGIIILAVMALVLRGPHVSNALKRFILPELEAALGKKVIAEKIYINLFPLFVEAKYLKAFDENGQKVFRAKRVKAYLDLSGVFRKTVTIRRLVIREPLFISDEEEVRELEKHIREYLAKQRTDALSVKVLAVELLRGTVDFRSESHKAELQVDGLQGEVLISDSPRVRVEAKAVKIQKEGMPYLSAGVSAQALMKGETITIKKAVIDTFGSRVEGAGEYDKGQARITASGDFLVATFKKIFGLKKSGEGKISVNGIVRYAKGDIDLDLSVGGNFYLETLMELLQVEEKLEGLVTVNGKVTGPLRELTAQGTAMMKQGNLYDVEIDSVECRVLYENNTLSFVDGDGSLYHGKARASASISLPVVDHFTLDIDFDNADSNPLFRLIGWDPGIPAGKVKGTLHHDGAEFGPKGDFAYISSETGDDLPGRVKTLTGRYDLEGDLLALKDLRVLTGKTEMIAGGTVDIKKETIDLQGVLKTPDVADLTLPYYGELKGAAGFTGKIQGTFQDPVIAGKATISPAVIEGYAAGTITGDLAYRKDLLQIKEIRAETPEGIHLLSGSISFKDAEELFDLSHPEYHLKASMNQADMGRFVKIFYPDFEGTGTFTASLRMEGSGRLPEVRADVTLVKASLYGVPVDSASFDFTYAQSRLEFRKASMRRGESLLRGDFFIHPDDTFSYKAVSDKMQLSDIIQRPLQGEVVLSLLSEGRGRFNNPSITVEARMIDGTLRGKSVGRGVITASVKDHEFSLRAKLINEKISVTAKGKTDGVSPWEASVDIQTGRYDFLITSVLRDVPEDLILSLNGGVSLHGTRNHVAGSASIRHMVLSMYGHTFTSEEEIHLDVKDREISLARIAMRSGNTLLRAGGGLTVGKNYNITIEGSSALSPFKSLSAKLGVLKGDSEFVVGITGEWDKPKINGGISLVNGSIGLKEYPSYRITNLSGYLYMDNDRVVLQTMNGKLGGGDVDLSGVLYLRKFAFSRFYVEAKLNNINSSLSNEFNVNFGGSILYKGTPEAQIVTGNIDINRARYRERVEWKSWLLQAKRIEKYKAEISNLEKAELNVKITGRDNIVIDNNVARAVVGADMLLKGTIYRPVLFGRLETREGTVFFRNNEFKILHASADFSDPKRLNPAISIAAETVVKGYKVKMNLEGQMDHFNMSLSSDPPLKEMDVLALLTVGQVGSNIKGIEAGIGASEATSFVTGKMQDVIEERLRSITGLDRFQIDPHVSKTTGTVEPRVTVSKRMLGEKVFVTYTTAVGSKEEQIIKLEYFMNKNVSLVGVRDERGITGGDVRFRFEFK